MLTRVLCRERGAPAWQQASHPVQVPRGVHECCQATYPDEGLTVARMQHVACMHAACVQRPETFSAQSHRTALQAGEQWQSSAQEPVNFFSAQLAEV